VGALAVHRQALAVPDALVRADLHLALDVLLDLALEIALDLDVLVDVGADLVDLFVGEIAGAGALGSIPVAAQICSAVLRPTPNT
jgi:hypothetical protein